MPNLSPGVKSCALHPESSGGTCGTVDQPVRILGKCESKDPEFQKKYLKLRRKETISIVPNEFARLGPQFVEAEHKISWPTQGFVERQAKFVV